MFFLHDKPQDSQHNTCTIKHSNFFINQIEYLGTEFWTNGFMNKNKYINIRRIKKCYKFEIYANFHEAIFNLMAITKPCVY